MKETTIDLTMSWVQALQVCLMLITSTNATARKTATSQLITMAELADSYVNLITNPIQHPEVELN